MDKYDHPLDMEHFKGMPAVENGEVAIPVSGIRILRFLDEDGDECIVYQCSGEALLPRTLGMIEWAKWALCRDSFVPGED